MPFMYSNVGTLHEPLTGLRWSGLECQRRIAARAARLTQCGVRPGDRVFVHYGNSAAFFVEILAIWHLGGCVVPIDPRFSAFEIETLARAATPAFSIWHEQPERELAARLVSLNVRLLESADRDDGVAGVTVDAPFRGLDQAALILFTSGTTGQPKGVVHTHRSLLARWTSLHDALGYEAFQRTLCILPTHFGHGLICNSLFPWLAGAELFIMPPFNADVVLRLGALIDEHRISFMSSVPTVWRLALRMANPPRNRSLERVFCGSAPLSAALWRSVQSWTGAKHVANAYGITETGSWLAGMATPEAAPEDGLIGRPWGGTMRISTHRDTAFFDAQDPAIAPGESGFVWVETPALMQGYFLRDDLTRQAVCQGWFSTGDIGFIDDRGLLYLRGREREEINVGGMKVYPGDVDAVVERFDGVEDACTFGFDEPLYGQNIGIAIVLKDRSEASYCGLHDWTARHLAKHQLPRRWYFVEQIPRSSRGKINRAEVAALCNALQPTGLGRTVQPQLEGQP